MNLVQLDTVTLYGIVCGLSQTNEQHFYRTTNIIVENDYLFFGTMSVRGAEHDIELVYDYEFCTRTWTDMNISELIYSKKYAVFNSKHMYITYIDTYPDQICLSFYLYQVYGNVVMFGNHFWRLQLEWW